MAFRYLSCLTEPVNLAFAEEITALWCEFEEGTTDAARLVRPTDALECMTQAVKYEERSPRQAGLKEFMELESRVTVPPLKDWVEHLKQEGQDIRSRQRADIPVLFVLGMTAAIDLTESS
jgi:5'-deoxynucleotidase YfbR-like HD superfamily hydrolase